MTAYDVTAWTDFANTVAGGAAALAGLWKQRSGEHPVRAVTSKLLVEIRR